MCLVEDEADSFLARLEIDVAEIKTYRQLKDTIKEKAGKVTTAQAEALWRHTLEWQRFWLPEGYRVWEVRFPWGRQFRYTRRGVRGWVKAPY